VRSLSTESETTKPDASARGFVPKLISSVFIAGVLAALDIEFKGAWAPWLHRLVPWILGAIVIYLVVSALRVIAPHWRQRSRERRINAQIREHVAALSAAFAESMSPSFAKSAGNVLNPLHSVKTLDARTVNAYCAHLGTLCTAALNLAADVRGKHLSPVSALSRLSDLHRDYTRVCCEVATAVASSARRELHIAWDEIRDNTNSISVRLEDLCRQVRELQGGSGPSPYFQNVPRSLPT
jgi:hypothetical protein